MEIVCTPETYRRFKSSSLRQTKKEGFAFLFLFGDTGRIEEDLRVGAVWREPNALPRGALMIVILLAKEAIDNCRAGRAAKGANPLLCARKYKGFSCFG